MIYHIVIPVDGSVETALSMRYTLVDTIEARGIGHVAEEGTGEDGMHVVVLVEGDRGAVEGELLALIESLGFSDAHVGRIDHKV